MLTCCNTCGNHEIRRLQVLQERGRMDAVICNQCGAVGQPPRKVAHMIGFLFGLVFLAFVLAAFFMLLKAILGTPAFAGLGPYTRVIYALVVFLVAVVLYQSFVLYPRAWPVLP